ncbi:ABC transporter C family member 8-like [Carya illinoinensis]|uniref:ABC transporter C family member 8-like n=1 Tax=Carya illinoinensis TaxID=32201 RepID=UPI001C722E57|nr:ABC transporter C family member 8-like [Carya illinoinensis]
MGFSWICEGEIGLRSYCIQRTIIDGVNMLFLCTFYLFFLIGFIGKHYARSRNEKYWILVVVSICCALCNIVYVTVGIWNLTTRNDEFNQMSWLVYFVRGLVWISFTASLLVQWSKFIRVLNSVWWMLSFALVSALNFELLLRSCRIETLDMVPWPINFLLFLCALRNLCHFVTLHLENMYIGFFAFLKTIFVVCAPLILFAFVNYSNHNERNLDEGLFIVGCLILFKVFESLSQRHWFFDSRRILRDEVESRLREKKLLYSFT